MIDGRPAATPLSPETYLADVQVERYSRSFLIHHPITINHNSLSGSQHMCRGSMIKAIVKEMCLRINNNKIRMCRMTPLLMRSLGTPKNQKNRKRLQGKGTLTLSPKWNTKLTNREGIQSSRTLSEKAWENYVMSRHGQDSLDHNRDIVRKGSVQVLKDLK